MKFYDDDTGSVRGVTSHLTALHFAKTQSIYPTGTPIIMTMTPDAGVVIYTALSVGGDFYGPNIYNKTQVDYIASTKQATITSSTLFNALNINALGVITASYFNSTGTVAALSINTGAIIATSLSISSSGSITTPSLTVS